MKTEEIKVDERTFTVRELLAKEVDGIDFTDKNKSIITQVKLGASLSDEEMEKLTYRERVLLLKAINKINGIGVDF